MARMVLPGMTRRERVATRKWTIICSATGKSFRTLSLKQSDAIEVAQWCDKHHPDCGPHLVRWRKKAGELS